jgi:hypothetical protein
MFDELTAQSDCLNLGMCRQGEKRKKEENENLAGQRSNTATTLVGKRRD